MKEETDNEFRAVLSSWKKKDFLQIHRVTAIKPCAIGHNIVGQQLPTLLGRLLCPFVRSYVAKSLTGFTFCATTPTNMQQGVQPTQHVTSNNVRSCWPTMLRAFARGLSCKNLMARYLSKISSLHISWIISTSDSMSLKRKSRVIFFSSHFATRAQ